MVHISYVDFLVADETCKAAFRPTLDFKVRNFDNSEFLAEGPNFCVRSTPPPVAAKTPAKWHRMTAGNGSQWDWYTEDRPQ